MVQQSVFLFNGSYWLIFQIMIFQYGSKQHFFHKKMENKKWKKQTASFH